MPDLKDILWMRLQWKRFRRMLGGALGLVWLLCCSGIVFIGAEDDNEWFAARMALLAMLVASSGVTVWLFIVAQRELRSLRVMADTLRLEAANAKHEAANAKHAARNGKRGAANARREEA